MNMQDSLVSNLVTAEDFKPSTGPYERKPLRGSLGLAPMMPSLLPGVGRLSSPTALILSGSSSWENGDISATQ